MRTPDGAFAASLDCARWTHTAIARRRLCVWSRARSRQFSGRRRRRAAEVFRGTTDGTFGGVPTLQIWSNRTTRPGSRPSGTGSDRPDGAADGARRQGGAAWPRLVATPGIGGRGVLRPARWWRSRPAAADAVWGSTGWRRCGGRRATVGREPRRDEEGLRARAGVRPAATADRPGWTAPGRCCGLLEQFDDGGAGFFDTAADAETLYTRPHDPTDNATPSGLSAALHALRLLAELTGETEYADRADRAAVSVGGLAQQAPRFAGWLLADAISALPGRTPVQVAIVGPADEARAELVRAAWRQAPGRSGGAGRKSRISRVRAAGRPAERDGRPTAYVCRGFVCRLR